MSPRWAALGGLVAAALACADRPAPKAPLSAPSSTPTAPAPAPAPATNASAEPTVLSELERQRARELEPKADAIVKAYGNFAPALTGDGKWVLFRSNRNGLSELFLGEVAKPGGAPKRLAGGPGRITFAAPTADGRAAIVAKEAGADEGTRFFRVALDGTGEALLTAGEPLQRDEPVLPRGRPRLMVYSARAATSPETRVLVQPLDRPAEARVAATDPGPASVVDVTPDGARALLQRYHAPGDRALFEVDLASGATKRLFPPEGDDGAVASAAYAADGRGVYVAADGDESSLLLLDARTLAVKARYRAADLPRARLSATVAPRGGRVAVRLDAGDHHRVRVLDAATLAPRVDVQSPPGSLGVGNFTGDGRRFALARSLPDAPPDVFAADAATGAVAPLRDEPREGLAGLPPLDVRVERVRSFDGLEVPVNVYLPKGAPPGRKLPTIVELHGGPAASASVGWHPFARFFTSLGFAHVSPNVRGSTGFGRAYEAADDREKRADALRDVEAVNAWAKAQPWCDAGRAVAFGGSYGGYLVLMALAGQPGRWRAGVDLVGVVDLATFLRSADPATRATFVDEFGDPARDAALLGRFSPINHVAKVAAPLFVYQGQNDPRVPRAEADLLVRGLRARGVPVEYMVAPDEGHSIDRRPNRVEFLTRVARFLGERLGLPGH